jgi:DNA polymerase III subunit delta'
MLLEKLSGGSVRRALSLHATGGLDLQKRLDGLVSSLPNIDWTAVHTLADEVSSPAAETKFYLVQSLLSALVARLVRAQATGAGAGGDVSLANRLISQERLAAWASLWETQAAENAVVDALNLDRKSLILQAFARLEMASRV